MTIDDLAALMARALNELKEDLVGEIRKVEDRFDQRFEQLDQRFEQQGVRIDGVLLHSVG